MTSKRPPFFAPSSASSGFALDDTDCNDRDSSVYPQAPEVCDGRDTDCSKEGDEAGQVDRDEDPDSDRHAPTTAQCAGGPFPRNDCDDQDFFVHPGATTIATGGQTPTLLQVDCAGTLGTRPAPTERA